MGQTRVDFYLLSQTQVQERYLYICRLARKAYNHSNQIYIHCDNEQQARIIDELLWTFHDTSFIPHQLIIAADSTASSTIKAPIAIGYQTSQHIFNDVLINLNQNVPDFFQKYKRILEIVCNEQQAKQFAREHFRYYRQHDCELHWQQC